jgi:hypothetical protein
MDFSGRTGFNHSITPATNTLFCCVALFLSAVMTFWLYHQENVFLQEHPYFYDGATYQVQHIELAQMAEKDGFLSAFKYNILHNAKEPLRPALLLLYPPLLKDTQGYIFLLLPLLAWFFYRLKQLVFLRTGNTVAAVSSVFVFTSLGVIYDPVLGLGAFWLDFFAGMLLACAIAEFRLFSLNNKTSHLLLTGFFLACCGLARYEAYFYEFVILGPVLLLFFWKSHRGSVKQKIKLLSILALPLLLLSGFHIIKHMAYIYEYNTRLNYGLGKNLRDSIWYIRTGLFQLSNVGFLLMLLIFPCLGLLRAIRMKLPLNRSEIIQAGWMWMAMPLLWTVVLRMSGTGAFYYILFVFPVFIVATLGWLPIPEFKSNKVYFLFIIAGLSISVQQGMAAFRKVHRVSMSERNSLMIQDAVIRSGIFKSGQNPCIAGLYNEETHPLYLRIYSQTSCLPRQTDSLVFSIHSNYYPAFYKTENPDTLTNIIHGYLNRKVNFAIALGKPEVADTSRQYTEKLPRIMAGRLSEALLTDTTHWQRVNTFSTLFFGELVILRNTGLKP